MTTLEKLNTYRDRLRKWRNDPAMPEIKGPEPKPEDFHLTSAVEQFMAKMAREGVMEGK